MSRYGCKATRRILILSNALSGGGAESVARLMVQRLEGASCVLFENNARVEVSGRQIWVASRKHRGGLGVTLLVNLWRLVVIQWVKITLRPAVTISHLEGPNFANMLTILGGRRMLFVHNRISESYPGGTFRERLKRRLASTLYHRAQRVVGVSPGVCRELTALFNVEHQKVLFAPNPIDRSAIDEASAQEYGDFRDQLIAGNYLISVASLTPQKNHELMLRMYRQLVDGDPRFSAFKLIILGDGELRDSLNRFCQELGLSVFDSTCHSYTGLEQVCFLGFQESPYRLLSQARLLLMTSRWEGLPIALLEAMSLGVPAVISDCSEGIREAWQVFYDNVGIAEPPLCRWTSFGALINGVSQDQRTIEAWTLAIKRLLEDDMLYKRCSRACMERSEDYDINRVVDIWEKELLTSG
ncbi:MAG TPA: glycosyltransferase [Gammaproteobacteria bacterium]|nr:glycosyltransferase [Gammaproteobacteria bacterium]